MSFMVLLAPVLPGVVIGFLLLDQKDDDTLTALQVTPLSLGNYLAYRIAVPTLLSMVMVLIVFPIAGLVKLGILPLLVSAVCAAPTAPMLALFYATFARNKVQGFAIMKATGIVVYPALFAYFLPPGWQLLFGVMPTFWPLKLVWVFLAGEPWWWFYFAMGILTQGAVIALLLRRFNRVMRQR
jgi:fluoroquinolone transport system permease protein